MAKYIVYRISTVAKAYCVDAESCQRAESKLKIMIDEGKIVTSPFISRVESKDMDLDPFAQCDGETV